MRSRVTFDALVRAGHLRRADHGRFERALTTAYWYPDALGYQQQLLTLRSGARLVGESYSHGVRLRVVES